MQASFWQGDAGTPSNREEGGCPKCGPVPLSRPPKRVQIDFESFEPAMDLRRRFAHRARYSRDVPPMLSEPLDHGFSKLLLMIGKLWTTSDRQTLAKVSPAGKDFHGELLSTQDCSVRQDDCSTQHLLKFSRRLPF
jgi:hypothetical protein